MLRRTFVGAAAGLSISALLAACAPARPTPRASELLPSGTLGDLPVAAPGPQILPLDPLMPTFPVP